MWIIFGWQKIEALLAETPIQLRDITETMKAKQEYEERMAGREETL